MTVKELSQLYYLNREIEDCQRKLEELEMQRGIGSPDMDGMPHAKGVKESQVEQLAAEIVDLKAIIHAKRIECIHERNRLERLIISIPDSLVRQIFEYRFADCMGWAEVARRVGGATVMDESTVRKICYRYLENTEGRADEKEREKDNPRHEMRKLSCIS